MAPDRLGSMQKRLESGRCQRAMLKGKKAIYKAEKVRNTTLNTAKTISSTKASKVLQDILKICGLDSRDVEERSFSMKSSVLEMFYWRRIIVDEFSYVKQNTPEHTVIMCGLQASFRWCLSGTPPLAGFADAKSIAAFSGFSLGSPEPFSVGVRGKQETLENELTTAEMFRSLMEQPCAEWCK